MDLESVEGFNNRHEATLSALEHDALTGAFRELYYPKIDSGEIESEDQLNETAQTILGLERGETLRFDESEAKEIVEALGIFVRDSFMQAQDMKKRTKAFDFLNPTPGRRLRLGRVARHLLRQFSVFTIEDSFNQAAFERAEPTVQSAVGPEDNKDITNSPETHQANLAPPEDNSTSQEIS